MAKNENTKNGNGSPKSGRYVGKTAGSSLAQAPMPRGDRSESSRSRRAEPSADELGLRAWKTTYKNSKTKAA